MRLTISLALGHPLELDSALLESSRLPGASQALLQTREYLAHLFGAAPGIYLVLRAWRDSGRPNPRPIGT